MDRIKDATNIFKWETLLFSNRLRARNLEIAAHRTAGQIDRTRPVCPYPQVARNNGSGDIDDGLISPVALPHRACRVFQPDHIFRRLADEALMEWYYAEQGQKRGPFTEPQLYLLHDAGRVQDDTLVWRAGAAGWRRFSERYAETPSVDLAAAWQGDRSSMRFAGFWIRVLANFIDTVILGSVLVLAALLFGPSLFSSLQTSTDFSTLQRSIGPLFCLVVIASSIAYQSAFVASSGATLGKLALGLCVIRSDGTPLSTARSIGRAVAFLVDVMVPFSLGFLIAGFDREKRTLHDYMAGTRVIHKPVHSVPWL